MKTASQKRLQIAEENVMADTVKAAEDGNGIIVRIYETWGMRTKVHVNCPLAPHDRNSL